MSAIRLRSTSTSFTRTLTTSPALTTLARVLHELVGQLRYVHQSILMHADIDEGAECRHVRHDALKHHAGPQIRDFLDPLLEFGRLELGPRIATGLLKLNQNIGDGRSAETLVGKLFGIQRFQECAVADHSLDRPLRRLSDALDDLVGLGMNGRSIERV